MEPGRTARAMRGAHAVVRESGRRRRRAVTLQPQRDRGPRRSPLTALGIPRGQQGGLQRSGALVEVKAVEPARQADGNEQEINMGLAPQEVVGLLRCGCVDHRNARILQFYRHVAQQWSGLLLVKAARRAAVSLGIATGLILNEFAMLSGALHSGTTSYGALPLPGLVGGVLLLLCHYALVSCILCEGCVSLVSRVGCRCIMPLNDEDLIVIDEALTSAAFQPEEWPRAVSRIVDAAGARGAVALPLRGRVPGVPMSESLGELTACYFENGWSERDYRANGIPKLMRTGIFADQDFASPETIQNAPFYAEYLRPLGFQWFAGLLIDVGGDTWTLTLQRSPKQGLFTHDEQTALKRLLPSLSRTARLISQIKDIRINSISDALESVNSPSILLDRFGRVLRVSRKAEGILGSDLNIRLGEIVIPGNNLASSSLRMHIAAAIWSEVKPDDPALRPVTVHRRDRLPLMLRAQPLRNSGIAHFDSCRAILTITDLDNQGQPDSLSLKEVYSLTKREIEICESLLAGASLNDIASMSGTSSMTVRSQMRSIFYKTQTNSQRGLVLLLSRLAKI